MKILVTDDKKENLKAAKIAAKKFNEHTFIFCSSAEKALNKIADCDAIVTDLFFPKENGEDLKTFYEAYVNQVENSSIFEGLVYGYYAGDREIASQKVSDAISTLSDGNEIKALEELRRVYTQGRFGDIDEVNEQIKNIKSSQFAQFAYGGVLMTVANTRGLKKVLVTDLHRHATNYKSPTSSIDGVVVLLPLIEQGILSIKEARYDGKGSSCYIGSDEGGCKKNTFEVWEKAFNLILSQ